MIVVHGGEYRTYELGTSLDQSIRTETALVGGRYVVNYLKMYVACS